MPIAIDDGFKSISTSCSVTVVNDPTGGDHDVLTVLFELFLRLFPHSSHQAPSLLPHYVLIRFLGVPDYFRSAKVYRVLAIDDESPVSAVTLKNDSNLVPFASNLTFNACTIQSIDPDTIPPLTQLVVSAPQHIYNILQHTPASSVRRKFVSEYLVHSAGVVSTNDVIRKINAKVLSTEPTLQGKVASSTNIVFVKSEDSPQHSAPEIDDDVDVSAYLSFDDYSIDTEHAFDIRPLPSKMAVDRLPPALAAEDPLLFVFMNSADFAKIQFPVFNGDIVTLVSGDTSLVVRVFTLFEPNKFDSDAVYVLPLLLINLTSTRVSIRPQETNASSSFRDLLPVAKSATISRIASPITMDKTYQRSFLSGLKSLFQKCLRCVRVGDVFPVPVDTVLSRTLFEVVDDEDEEEVVPEGDPDALAWFHVVGLSGDASETQQYVIDPAKTALTSSGLDFKRLPENSSSHWYQYLGLPPLFSYPSHAFKYAADFRKVVQTCLSAKAKLKTLILLNSMSRGLGKTTVVRSTCLELGLNLIELDSFELLNPGAELKTLGTLTGKIDKLLHGQQEPNSSFHVVYIKHIENLCVQSNPNEQGANQATSLSLKVAQALDEYLEQYPNLIVVFSTNDVDKLNDSVRQMVKFQIDLGVPSEAERLEIFKFLIDHETGPTKLHGPEAFEDRVEFKGRFDVSEVPFAVRQDIQYQALALQLAGLTPNDLISIVKKAKQLAIQRLEDLAKLLGLSLQQIIQVGNGGVISFVPDDFAKAINDARNQFSDSIGAPRIPNVKWEDIGGLDLVKDEILDTIDMPLKHPELFSNGLKKRSGILFYGPPGTGKTLLAKAIATNFSLNFFSVKGPELLNMYIGESEANVRRVFQKARDAKPCVIFFDELDSVAPKRGNQGDSGGVMDRIVSQLLAELDGMSGGENNGDGVFVVGATNRPDLLDEALLRPGRFDKMLYLGISDTDEKQAKILEALTRKFKLADDVDLHKIARGCSFTFTGADFYALCLDLMLNAMTRSANDVDKRIKALNEERKQQGLSEVSTRWWFDNVATPADTDVVVTMEDFLKAQSELSPSVSAEELQHYLRVRENFEGGKEKARAVESAQIPQQLLERLPEGIDPSQISEIVDANGNSVHGHLNGPANGHPNGHANGHANGHSESA